jgi:hypothetical protein
MGCGTFHQMRSETSLETLKDIKDRIKSLAGPPAGVRSKVTPSFVASIARSIV